MGLIESQGDSRSQDGTQYPRTWGMDQRLSLSSGCESWGMVMYLGMGGGVGKEPRPPEGSSHPLLPIWPSSDHQALTTQGACPF